MKKITVLFNFIFAICEIIVLSSEVSLDYYSNLENTYSAVKAINEMYRRVRRQNILSPNNRRNSFNNVAKSRWQKAYKKVKIMKMMEHPKLFQGDMLLTPKQKQIEVERTRQMLKRKNYRLPRSVETNLTREKRRVLTDFAAKWDLPINIYIGPNVDQVSVSNGLADIQDNTCLKFRKVNVPNNSPGIHYHYGTMCCSYVGKIDDDKYQEVSLGPNCDKKGIVIHETLHTLGQIHEQSRPDRDKYVKINYQNIMPGKENNFEFYDEERATTFGIPFDYGSIMQYGASLFSVNKQLTTAPIDMEYLSTMGTLGEASFYDYKYVNQVYCNNICQVPIQCRNWGYQDPNNCSKCKCPPGFEGNQCENFITVAGVCGKIQFRAMNNIQETNISGMKNCIFVIVADKGSKIAYKVMEAKFDPNYVDYCEDTNTLSIKYYVDKSVSGASFCDFAMTEVHISHDNYLIIEYKADKQSSYAKVLFKQINKFS